jgi:hypothetical protein
MNHSGKGNPCPICGRGEQGSGNDDKCRWNDNFYFCYQGSVFAPPDVSPGDVIEINGLSLACVTTHGGFAGSSTVFTHDRPRAAQGRSGWAIRQRRERAEAQVVLRSRLEREIPRIRKALKKVCNCKNFYDSTINEINEIERLSASILNDVDTLLSLYRSLRPKWDSAEQQRKVLQDTWHSAMLAHKDVCGFKAHYLHR